VVGGVIQDALELSRVFRNTGPCYSFAIGGLASYTCGNITLIQQSIGGCSLFLTRSVVAVVSLLTAWASDGLPRAFVTSSVISGPFWKFILVPCTEATASILGVFDMSIPISGCGWTCVLVVIDEGSADVAKSESKEVLSRTNNTWS
jgi:hypothetical protein